MDPALVSILNDVVGGVLGGSLALLGITLVHRWQDRRDDRRRFCSKPGRGWYCTYAAGHRAECDVWPEWWMTLWVRLNWRSR